MAKMFYTLEETAEKLGKNVDEIKEMASGGQLQQFRDRDKVMFKVDQVDRLAANPSESSEVDLSESDMGGIPPVDTDGSDTDTIGLADSETETPAPTGSGGSSIGGSRAGRSGVSVFDADEVDAADPAAQTVVSASMEGEDELSLESVGSGSGLLDLTRESDDTSLGAELLEEIYPGGATGESKGTATALEGMFESTGGSSAGASGLGDIESPAVPVEGGVGPTLVTTTEQTDPVGSGWTGGLLVGAIVALVLGLVVIAGSMPGVPAGLALAMAGNLLIYLAGLFVLTAVAAVVGLLLGKAIS